MSTEIRLSLPNNAVDFLLNINARTFTLVILNGRVQGRLDYIVQLPTADDALRD